MDAPNRFDNTHSRERDEENLGIQGWRIRVFYFPIGLKPGVGDSSHPKLTRNS
jgi:hypothetical protein